VRLNNRPSLLGCGVDSPSGEGVVPLLGGDHRRSVGAEPAEQGTQRLGEAFAELGQAAGDLRRDGRLDRTLDQARADQDFRFCESIF
jgi:hypothetical protein